MDRFPLPKARVCASVDLRKQALSGALGTADLRAACVQQRSPLATSVSEEERKEEEEEVEEEEAADGPPAPLLSSCSAAAGPHTKASQAQTHHPRSRRAPDLTSWRQYWDERLEVELPGRGTFSVYCAGPATAPAALLCLHGAGYTGLTWSLVAQRLKHKYRMYAPDLRGHGLTRTASDTDFSHQTIAQDVAELWAALRCTAPHPPTPEPGPPPSPPTPASHAPEQSAGAVPPATHAPAAPVSSPPAPALLLVGHSMGGAMAVWAAAGPSAAAPAAPCAEAAAAGPAAGQAGGTAPQGSRRPPGPPPPALPGLAGLVVVDVVEGTALGVVASRPTSFPSASQAVSWALATGMARCPEAAAISIPAQLRQLIEEPAAAQGGEQQGGQQQQQEEGGGASSSCVCGSGAWAWRTPLLATQPYWQAWYSGLSDAFLQVPGPKLLILAGTDRLDRALTIGQMQGRFQLVLLPQAGHAVQEDQAEATARHLADFLAHFRIGEPPMVLPRAPPGTRPVLPLVAGPVLPGRAPGPVLHHDKSGSSASASASARAISNAGPYGYSQADTKATARADSYGGGSSKASASAQASSNSNGGRRLLGDPPGTAPAPATARVLPVGSYTASCDTCKLSAGGILRCDCLGATSRRTSLLDTSGSCPHVANCGGQLQCTRDCATVTPRPTVTPAGPYARTCQGCYWVSATKFYCTTCVDDDGKVWSAWLSGARSCPSVRNCDGVLKCNSC
ncbi:hypothetical protein QJQ45_018358 [Haematococcus lacustris]|nr:hypothetical protein QJQ45_018358 [Haematococcus lacustris]